MYHFVIPGEPRTKKNSQRIIQAGNRRIVLPSKAFEEYQDNACFFIPDKGIKIDKPCEVTALFYMRTKRRVDLTNLLEALDDIIVHYELLADDNYMIITSHDGSRVKYDKNNPRTEVTIKILEE